MPALILALAWLLPFCLPDHKIPIGTFWQEWTAATLLIVALAGGLIVRDGRAPLQIPHILWLIAGLAGVILAQAAAGLLHFSANAVVPLLYLGLATFACMLGASLRSNERTGWATAVAVATIIGGVFTVYAQIAQSLGIDRVQPFLSALPVGQQPFGNINQVNHTATYLGWGLTAIVFLRAMGQLNTASTSLLILILATGLALTGQRSALVHAALPLLLTLVLWRRLPAPRASALRTSLCAFGLFLAISLLLPQSDSVTVSTPLTKLAAKAFYSDRMNFWEHAWAMFMAHPLLGVGFDQFWPHFFTQLDTLPGGEAPNHPHNLFAALLSETGLVGTLLVTLALAAWVWRQRQAKLSWPHWLGLGQLAMIGFHSLIEYPLWYAYFLIPAAFWLGFTDVRSHRIAGAPPRWAASLVAAAALVLLASIGLAYQQLRTQVWRVPHPGIARLVGFQPPEPAALDALAGHWFFEREVLFWQPDLQPIRLDRLPDDIELTQRAMRVAPSSALLFRLCLLRVLNGETDEAVRLLRRAAQIYPVRYAQMQLALPQAAQRWPGPFEAALPRLLGVSAENTAPAAHSKNN